ncbi:uncharacterized protein LOC116416812 [Nasonia vitripennis]|uniref:Uncharacterized protein n=1 Tax=Nasonia vitripennis TaxID=7425 RepID=A0A7M7Q6X6_NASVI|nr:uncharacterized protein LOC116416812 [Nasonia vitripennis]
MGWYLNPSSGTCEEAISTLTYVEGNFTRAKHPNNLLKPFSDNMLPRSFYTETLIRKSSIDYTYGIDSFYISDDTDIYRLNKSSEAIDGDQKKIFSVREGSLIRNIDFEVLNEYLYYVDENSTGERSIAALSLVAGEPARKSKVKSQVDVFLIGAFYSLIYSPNWDEIFGPQSLPNDHFSKKSRLRYFDMHELVSLDPSGDRLCWISNTSVTKIEYLHFKAVESKYFDRGVMDLPIMINPMSLAIGFDWIFIANFTGIWRFSRSCSDRGISRER